MNDYRLLTKEEQLIYMIKFYRNYLNQIKLILEQLEKELGEERGKKYFHSYKKIKLWKLLEN